MTFAHDVANLLDHLSGQPVIDRTYLAQLEWRYLPLLELHERSPRILHGELARNPQFFVDVIGIVYRSDQQPEDGEVTDEMRQRATLGYQLLRSWRTPPGTDSVSGELTLVEWVRQARALLIQRGLVRPGDRCIGNVLRYAAEDSDGTWPPVSVRDIIEEVRSRDFEYGIEVEVYNSRGGVWRALDDGGASERALAEKYQRYARLIDADYHRTQGVLRRIAVNWERDARREDQLAEIREDFWS